MDISRCKRILDAVSWGLAFRGDISAMKRYFNAGDVDGFERVCRGSHEWLRNRGIAYDLTDGAAECWYDNGQMCEQLNFINGRLHGQRTWWYDNGQLLEQSNYVNGRLHGQSTCWHEDGKVIKQSNYDNGVKQP
jgi:antitoxin component YwqK of YwqJK toxin-antitoxin module